MRYRDPLKRILDKGRCYWDHDGVPAHERAAFRKVLQCRTRALGAEVFASESAERIVYHTCKSRACPVCGFWATVRWQNERLAALPPVLYKGITFTMPDVLWHVFRENRSLADALPALAAGAIEAMILARHGLQTGIVAILHTFNGKLKFNAHVHTMVLPAAGGYPLDLGYKASTLIKASSPGFGVRLFWIYCVQLFDPACSTAIWLPTKWRQSSLSKSAGGA